MFKGKDAYAQALEDYEATNIAEAQTACLRNINEVSKKLTESADNIERVTDSIEDELNQPQTVIEGVIPS